MIMTDTTVQDARVASFEQDMRTNGWKLVSLGDTEHIHTEDIEVLSFVGEWEEYVLGMDMLERSQGLGANLSQRSAEFLLANSENIPNDWKPYRLLFSGTVWRSRTGHFHVPALQWKDDNWQLVFCWFAFDFHARDRFTKRRA